MIKLKRGEKPKYLTDEKVEELTFLFKSDKSKSVWKHKDIHAALLLSSSSKCAFCEIELNLGSSYMEIEHFKLKNSYPDDVVSWDNLLPSCKRCNTSKLIHDVVVKPIINPFDVDPTEHLTQSACRIYFKTILGEQTRDVLDLNDPSLIRPRFEVWNFVIDRVEEIHRDTISKSKISKHDRNKLSRLLVSCQPDRAFSAFASTSLHSSEEYSDLVKVLKDSNQWDDYMEELHQNSLRLVISKR